MAEIRIEGKPAFGSPFDHMYLVYVDDSGDEFVIRGGPQSVLGFGHILPLRENHNRERG